MLNRARQTAWLRRLPGRWPFRLQKFYTLMQWKDKDKTKYKTKHKTKDRTKDKDRLPNSKDVQQQELNIALLDTVLDAKLLSNIASLHCILKVNCHLTLANKVNSDSGKPDWAEPASRDLNPLPGMDFAASLQRFCFSKIINDFSLKFRVILFCGRYPG